MNLKEFMANPVVRNLYIEEPGWDELYVRKGKRFLGGEMQDTLELANIAATRTGEGAFKNLISTIQKEYPSRVIFIENVLTHRFEKGLLRMGFKIVSEEVWPPCFWLGYSNSSVLGSAATPVK